MKRVEDLYALTEIGSLLGELEGKLGAPRLGDMVNVCLRVRGSLIRFLGNEVIPVSVSKAPAEAILASTGFIADGQYLHKNWLNPLNNYLRGTVSYSIEQFQIALREELRYLFFFLLEQKGNLSITHLVSGASVGYAPAALKLLDDMVKGEIDEAGRCLAFSLATAAGFHILRSVEMVAKGYLFAANGCLPPTGRRNWAEYIAQLEKVSASSDVIDLLKILKARRNPLMHPQHSLEIEEAIGLVAICQSATETLISDVRSKGLELEFSTALRDLSKS